MIIWEAMKLPTKSLNHHQASSLHHMRVSIPSNEDIFYNKTLQALNTVLKSLDRPLLVRFDWYSQKRTPIHIG